MKALTLWQPWASLVVAGAKPYEFRSWRPPAAVVGQRIVVHASARKVDPREVEQLRSLLNAGGRYAAATYLMPIDAALAVLDAGTWPMGAGLGSAVVGSAVSGDQLAIDFGVVKANDSSRNYHSNWGWPMLEVELWTDPLPVRGAQGLWTWPEPAAEWTA